MIALDYDALPKRIRSEMSSDIAIPLVNDAEPFDLVPPAHFKDGIGAEVRVFAASGISEDDLVEYRWNYLDKPITVVVSRNARRIEFDLSTLPECRSTRGPSCVRAAKEWVARVVKLKGRDRFDNDFEITLPWPNELADGVSFSSAPDLDIAMAFRWHLRLDADVRNDVLTIFVYKRFPHIQGGFQDGSKWFDDDFRALVQAKAAAQGR